MSEALDFVTITDNDVPQNASVNSFKSFDGLNIRYGLFKAMKGLCHGTVCLFTGRSEPIEKYFEVIKKLQLRGFNVAIMDWRGQGLSDRLTNNRRKGHVVSFDNYVKDVEHFMRKAVWPDCPAPYFAIAHSMGSNVLTKVAALPNKIPLFERIVLISPFYQFEISGLKFLLVEMIARILSVFGLGKLKATFLEGVPKELKPFDPGNLISSDQYRMEREQKIIKANMRLALGAPTFGWLNAAFKSIREVGKISFAKKIKTPMLVIMGTDDYLVSQESIETISGNISACGLVKIDGGKHELLMENDRLTLQVWGAIDAFIPGSYKVDQNVNSDSAFS